MAPSSNLCPVTLLSSIYCKPYANCAVEWRKNLVVDVTIHLNDLQKMVMGEYAEALGPFRRYEEPWGVR